MKVLYEDNPFFEVSDIERLRELAKKTENQFKNKTIFIIADMSVFHHIKKAAKLLEYEKTLQKGFQSRTMESYVCIINVIELLMTNQTNLWNIIKIKRY